MGHEIEMYEGDSPSAATRCGYGSVRWLFYTLYCFGMLGEAC